MKIEQLISKNLKNYVKYSAGEAVSDLKDRLNLEDQAIIKLDANENVFIDPDWIRERINEAIQSCTITLYPDILYTDARIALGNYLGIKPEQILLGNGSDDVLDVVAHAFLDNTSELISAEPSFLMYEFFTKILGAKYVITLLDENFDVNVEKVLTNINKNTKIILLASPNNPTGNQYSTEKLRTIVESTDRIVVLDEAYVDFADFHLLDWIKKYDNLVITRTFSKSWGLAGLRVGYAVSNPEMIQFLKNVQKPYTLNTIGQAIIPIIIKSIKYIDETIETIKKERKWLEAAYKTIEKIRVYPSVTNFFLLRILKKNITINKLIEQLNKQGIFIRDQSTKPLLQNCVRITVGTRTMNEIVIEALKKILGEN